MKRVVFWFDVISPFTYLAFEHLPQALEGCSYEVQYRPVLFAGLLGHWGQKGPAEIVPKRAWTFRHVAWLSRTLGIPDLDSWQVVFGVASLFIGSPRDLDGGILLDAMRIALLAAVLEYCVASQVTPKARAAI